MIELYEGDCRVILPAFSEDSFDMVVTDPPYGQTNEGYDGPNAISLRPEIWAECYRVCGPNAALVAFAGSPTYHRIASAIESGGWKVRQMWGWVYRDGMISSAYPKEGFDRLAPAMDPIVFATKGKVLLSLEREGNGWEISGQRSKASPMSERFRSPETKAATGHWPKSIVSDGEPPFEYFVGSRTASRKGDRTNHPNQKPLGLMQWIIAKIPGSRVLDPFAGSGTTLLAARTEGRKAVGIELDPNHCDIIRKRCGL